MAQTANRSAELDKAVEEARAAYLALQEAEKRRDEGIESQAGERQGSAAGGSRPTDAVPSAARRSSSMDVELARRRYEAAVKALERSEVETYPYHARAMNPALGALLLGATCIALSPIFVRLSEAGPDRHRVLAGGACRSRALAVCTVLKAKARSQALLGQMAAAARRRVRLRRRPRLLARLDPADLGGEFHAARQPGVDLRHARGVDLPAAEADAPVPRRAWPPRWSASRLLVHTSLAFSSTGLRRATRSAW